MFVCPQCGWPFETQNRLDTHILIRHQDQDKLSALVKQVRENWEGVELVDDEDELLDDGVYTDDVVVHAPYDDED